jgi:hypothetical protein
MHTVLYLRSFAWTPRTHGAGAAINLVLQSSVSGFKNNMNTPALAAWNVVKQLERTYRSLAIGTKVDCHLCSVNLAPNYVKINNQNYF